MRALRRLLYCGEWIQSHALHVYLLHAPDFLGYPTRLDDGARPPRVVEQGLALKQTGNQLIAAARRPAGPPGHASASAASRRVPRRRDLDGAPAGRSTTAARQAQATVEPRRHAATPPAFEREPPLRRAAAPRRVPLQRRPDRLHRRAGHRTRATGATRSTRSTVEGSNALHARTRDGRGLPARARRRASTLAADRLHPLAAEALRGTGLAERDPRATSYRSIVARAVELVHACAEALDIIDAYRPPAAPARAVARRGRASPPGPRRRRAASSSTATRWTSRAT